jgi:hypothetical protein
MDVFVSWSGETGNKIADEFTKWLPMIIQAVKPFYSRDILKGATWNSEITKKLKSSRIGIIIVTEESKEAPWLLFEAGAISNNFDDAHVCPIIFGLQSTDIKGPLTQFQMTPFEKNEIKKLIHTINAALEEDKLDSTFVDNIFEKFWSDLEDKISNIISADTSNSNTVKRSDRELLEEILELTRQIKIEESQYTTEIKRQNRLGTVIYDKENNDIVINSDGYEYYIGMEQLSSGAQILDMILQTSNKTWSSPEITFRLIKLLDKLSKKVFGTGIQGVFCTFGENKQANWPKQI